MCISISALVQSANFNLFNCTDGKWFSIISEGYHVAQINVFPVLNFLKTTKNTWKTSCILLWLVNSFLFFLYPYFTLVLFLTTWQGFCKNILQILFHHFNIEEKNLVKSWFFILILWLASFFHAKKIERDIEECKNKEASKN